MPVVAHWTAAAGTDGSCPYPIRASHTSASFRIPISMIFVPCASAIPLKSREDAFLFSPSWPVNTVNCVQYPRCVTGMPA